MKFDRLLTAFSKIGDDPERIQQLRKIAVGLAISGKLDDRATALQPVQILDAVERVKAALVQQGALPKQKKYSEVTEEQLPEAFSETTRFACLGSLARIEKGQTGIKQAQPGSFPLVVTAAERSSCDHHDFEGAAAIVPLVSSTGHGNASLNRLHYEDGKFALGTILAAAFPHDPNLISARFLFEYLTAFKDELLVSRMTGTANVTLSVGSIAEVPVPLVCPEVQKKVDELMTLCDRLEAALEKREATRDRLTTASLARLDAPDPNPKIFRHHIAFALEDLATLTTRHQIKALRQTILNLAVRGKLVEQDPADEPVSEMLKRIADERARLLKAKAIPRQKPAKPDPGRFIEAIPDSWLCIPLGDVINFVTSGSRGWAKYYSETGPGFIRAQNIRFGHLILDDLAHVHPPPKSEGSRTQVSKGDLLIVITGAGVTNPAMLERDLGEAYVSQHVGLVRPTDTKLSDWLLLCQMAECGGRAELAERAYGAGRPGLNLDNIRSLTIPLPPLAEQHRIVAKVDAVMALCDRLEARLATGDDTRRRLLDSVLRQALEAPTMAAA